MFVTIVAALLIQAVPADPDLADGRCVAVMNQLAKQADKGDKGGIESAMMYFLGKIVGRSGAAAVSPAIEKGAAALVEAGGDAALGKLAEPCTAEMNRTLAD